MGETVSKDRVALKKDQIFYLKIKRGLDITCAVLAMIVLAPIFLAAAVAIKIEDPTGTVFYCQKRIGCGGRPFKIYKFRTMQADTPELSTGAFPNAWSYVTKVGRFMRPTSMDELPQLLNVLKGDMSLIGPRPLMPIEQDVHRKRFLYGLYQVRPGISGMAQTHGRDEMDDDVKVQWDRKYVEEISFFLDLKLIFRTVFQVVQRAGVREWAAETAKRNWLGYGKCKKACAAHKNGSV